MNYKTMMRDAASYIERHIHEELDAESMGQIYSYTDGYFCYLFSTYYEKPLDAYIENVRDRIQSGKQIFPEYFVRKVVVGRKANHATCGLPAFSFAGNDVILSKESLYDPGKAVAIQYESLIRNGEITEEEPYLSMWWHDESYTMQYLQGTSCEDVEAVPEDKIPVYVPSSEYEVFSLEKREEETLDETMKYLVNYVLKCWEPQNERKPNRVGYTFQCYIGNMVYFCMPILEEEKQEPKDTIYSVDTWTKYIDEHITMNLTTTALAEKFSYSDTHFKRIFRYYYKMSVSDYIRKRRLQAAAEQIREGVPCKEVAAKYNFKTYAGFSRAFQKEFNMTPAQYSNSVFEVVDLACYYKEYKDRMKITFLEMKETRMIGQSVLQGKGEDADLPAQVCYWLDKDFPCLENTRFSCNKERREEKIALWYHVPERGNVEYILGPVVDEFDEDIPEEMIKVTVDSGKYAMFETEKESDKDNVAETFRMFYRCASYGWVKEHRERVDLSRIPFERYLNNKVYFYIPIKY